MIFRPRMRLDLHPLWSPRSTRDSVPNGPPAEIPHRKEGGFISYLAPEPLGGVPEELEKVETADPDPEHISRRRRDKRSASPLFTQTSPISLVRWAVNVLNYLHFQIFQILLSLLRQTVVCSVSFTASLVLILTFSLICFHI